MDKCEEELENKSPAPGFFNRLLSNPTPHDALCAFSVLGLAILYGLVRLFEFEDQP